MEALAKRLKDQKIKTQDEAKVLKEIKTTVLQQMIESGLKEIETENVTFILRDKKPSVPIKDILHATLKHLYGKRKREREQFIEAFDEQKLILRDQQDTKPTLMMKINKSQNESVSKKTKKKTEESPKIVHVKNQELPQSHKNHDDDDDDDDEEKQGDLSEEDIPYILPYEKRRKIEKFVSQPFQTALSQAKAILESQDLIKI